MHRHPGAVRREQYATEGVHNQGLPTSLVGNLRVTGAKEMQEWDGYGIGARQCQGWTGCQGGKDAFFMDG